MKQTKHSMYLSAKLGDGIDDLKTEIKRLIGYQPSEGQFLARRRQIGRAHV